MKQKLAELFNKLDWQHAFLFATLIVTTIGPDVVNILTDQGMSALAVQVTHDLALIAGLLALVKQFVPPQVVAARMAARAAVKHAEEMNK